MDSSAAISWRQPLAGFQQLIGLHEELGEDWSIGSSSIHRRAVAVIRVLSAVTIETAAERGWPASGRSLISREPRPLAVRDF